MKSRRFTWVVVAVVSLSILALTRPDRSVTATLTYGTPDVQSVGALAFGADNLLLVGDSDGAAVFALDVNDTAEAGDGAVNVADVDKKIAALLGTTPDAIAIHDLAVHPVSQQVYLSVTRGAGAEAAPVLVRVTHAGDVESVSMEDINFSKASITNAPAEDATDRRGRSLRTHTITDLAFADGNVYVAGLSNEEFASNFRQLPFPFTDQTVASSLEIFHVSHGQFETHAPIRTFMPHTMDGQAHILAAYTCTPLVVFPVGSMEDGTHVKGKTVAELGNGNTPLDMVSIMKDGQEHILIANSSRGVMLVDAAALPGAENLTEPSDAESVGVAYTTLPWSGVVQMAKLGGDQIVVLEQAAEDGPLQLRTYPTSDV